MLSIGMIVAYCIFGVGILIFLFLIFRARRKAKGISHYEDTRDKLTVREEEEEDNSKDDITSTGSSFSLQSLISGFVVILIGVSLIKPITDQVNTVITSPALANVTTVSSTVLQFVPGFFALAVLGVAIFILLDSFKSLSV